LKTNLPCWWCRYEFSNSPIGVPLRYYPEKNMFDTEGIFCSFSCCKSYMLDNPSYKKYMTLLYLLNLKLIKNVTSNIKINELDGIQIRRSPHWKLLERSGGSMSITEFRNSIVDSQYYITPNTKNVDMRVTGTYFEKIKV